MVDVFEEVEEGLRAERWKTLARKYLPWAAAGLGAGLLVAGGVWGFDAYRNSQIDKASAEYAEAMEALRAGDTAKAETALKATVDVGAGGYKSLALMQQAALRLSEGKTQDAVGLFDQAARAAPDPVLGDLARLKAAFALIDTAPVADVQKRLEPMLEEGRPYRALAREALAVAKIRAGDLPGARSEFVVLSLAQDTPEALRERAQAAIQAIDSGAARQTNAIATAAAALPPEPQLPPGLDLSALGLPPGAGQQ